MRHMQDVDVSILPDSLAGVSFCDLNGIGTLLEKIGTWEDEVTMTAKVNDLHNPTVRTVIENYGRVFPVLEKKYSAVGICPVCLKGHLAAAYDAEEK